MPSPIVARVDRLQAVLAYVEKNPGARSDNVTLSKLGILLKVSPITISKYLKELGAAMLIKWDFKLKGYIIIPQE